MKSRRDILRASAWVGGVLACGPLGRVSASPQPLPVRLAKLLSNRSGAARVGRAFLALRPDEANAGTLSVLVAGVDNRERLARMDDATMRGFLRVRRQRDFEAGRVVRVRGWVLAETEARLCAIVSLTSR